MAGKLTDEEVQAHAERIGDEILESAEFCWIYEDPELEDYDEDDWLKVHSALTSLVTIDTSQLET